MEICRNMIGVYRVCRMYKAIGGYIGFHSQVSGNASLFLPVPSSLFFNPVTYASSRHRHIWAIIIVNFEVLGCRVLARHYDSG